MAQVSIDLARVKQRYQTWLAANKPSFWFRKHRQAIVQSLAGVEPETIVDIHRTLAHWPELKVSRPTVYRLLGELSQAGVLIKFPADSNYVFRVDRSFFSDLDEA